MEDVSKWQILLLRRNIVGILAFVGFINVYSLRVNLSVAIVDMVANRSVTLPNGTTVYQQDFNWDTRQKGHIQGAFYYGYICTQLVGGWLSSKYGGARIYGGGITVTALLTLLTPVVCYTGGIYALMTIRVIEGIFEGVTYPSIHAVWSRWAPPTERTRLASLAFAGSFVGTVISFPVCGLIAELWGWSYTFYATGTVALIWCLVWLIVVKDDPIEDKWITEKELRYIQESLGPKQQMTYPWKKMLTSMPVWSIVCAHFCENWGFYTLLTQLPSYLNDVYSLPITTAASVSACPYIVMSLTLIIAGFFVDMLRQKNVLTTTQIRKLFNCGAFLSQTIFMTGAAFSTSVTMAIGCLTLAVGLGAFAWTAFSVNPLDIAPQYASVIMGISNTFATLAGIFAPTVAGYITVNKTVEEWRAVFAISATIYVIGFIFYACFASAEKQPWAESENSANGEKTVAEITNGTDNGCFEDDDTIKKKNESYRLE